MESSDQTRLINFLREDLAVPPDAIAMALRHHEQTVHFLPVVMWQYGLITLEQLDKIFDWMETA